MADSSPKKASAPPPAMARASEAAEDGASMPEPKLPSRKDASLKEFLGKMDDYAPIVRLNIPSSYPLAPFFGVVLRARNSMPMTPC